MFPWRPDDAAQRKQKNAGNTYRSFTQSYFPAREILHRHLHKRTVQTIARFFQKKYKKSDLLSTGYFFSVTVVPSFPRVWKGPDSG